MPRVILAASPWARLIVLSDTPGKGHATLSENSLLLISQNGKATAFLDAADLGPSLYLKDAQQFKAVVGVTDLEVVWTGESHKTSAAAVTLFGKDGKVIWRAP